MGRQRRRHRENARWGWRSRLEGCTCEPRDAEGPAALTATPPRPTAAPGTEAHVTSRPPGAFSVSVGHGNDHMALSLPTGFHLPHETESFSKTGPRS